MKVITLSDHTGDMIAEAENARRFEYDRQQAVYDAEYRRQMDEKERRKARYDEVRVLRDQRTTEIRTAIDLAWSGRQYIRAVLSSFWLVAVGFAYMLWEMALSVNYEMFRVTRHEASMPMPTGAEEAWRVGHQGEMDVVDHLGGRFGDEWTLIGGYLTSRGEIDQVLVGPAGVMAMEVKNLGGTIYIDGVGWWRSRGKDLPFDPVTDGGRRSPAQQLDETATELERVLSRHMDSIPAVIRTVALANPLCEIQTSGTISGVHHVSKTRNLAADLFRIAPARLRADQIADIVERIREDHVLNERKHGRRGPRFGGVVSDR